LAAAAGNGHRGVVERKNKNRGYRQLRVWQDAIELYKKTCAVFTQTPYEYKRVVSKSYKLENSLLCLIQSLEQKKINGEWEASLIIRESNEIY